MGKKSTTEVASSTAIGEVISSSVTNVIAQCWLQENANGLPQAKKPNFGSFLRIECNEAPFDVFAVVYNVITGPPDTVHKPSALKMSREQLKVEQPHIFALLRTEVRAMIIGYTQADRMFQHLPPQPPEVHDFAYPATTREVQEITEELDFLRLLCGVTEVPADELLAASIREAYQCRDHDYDFLVAAGQSLSHLLRADYDRLLAVLRKIRPEAL